MKVSNLMSSKVEFTTPTSTTKEAARQMHDEHVGALPVVVDEQLVGIITDRDICCKVTATGRDAGWTKVEEVMTKDVVTCLDDLDTSDAANIMIDHNIRRLAVLNHQSALVGFLSVDDLARSSYELASSVLEASRTVH
jgi:CBS domain-containing protein